MEAAFVVIVGGLALVIAWVWDTHDKSVQKRKARAVKKARIDEQYERLMRREDS